MKIRSSDLEPQKKAPNKEILDWTKKKYNAYEQLVAFQDDDSVLLMGFKLFLRFLGIIFMIIISPFVILGVIIAFMAVL